MEPRWRVLLTTGETSMTLDELDEAFNCGRIDASTLVLEPGAVFWAKLGAIAGLPMTPASGVSVAPLNLDVDVDLTGLDHPTARSPRRYFVAAAAALGTIALIALIATGTGNNAAAAVLAAKPQTMAMGVSPVPTTPPVVTPSLAAPPPPLVPADGKPGPLMAKEKKKSSPDKPKPAAKKSAAGRRAK
jgi:hypothetical protein